MASDDREFKAHTSLQDPTIVYPSPDKRRNRPCGNFRLPIDALIKHCDDCSRSGLMRDMC
jgi:hypothetical protein